VTSLGGVGLLADLGRFGEARERLDDALRQGAASRRVTDDAGPRVAAWLDAVSP
jgi:hypothetical protein